MVEKGYVKGNIKRNVSGWLYLRTYKSHPHVDTVDHNNKSGNSLKTFSFFDELNQIKYVQRKRVEETKASI